VEIKGVVVLDTYLHEEAQKLLNTRCRMIACKSSEQGIDTVRKEKAVAAIPSPTWQFTDSTLDMIPSLLVIGRPGIGVDNIDLKAATERGVIVINTPDAPTISTARTYCIITVSIG